MLLKEIGGERTDSPMFNGLNEMIIKLEKKTDANK